MNELMRQDLEARRRIREDIHTNFFVEAGAGSGKTTALVDRMAAMVESGIEVERICAITFTVAASREFFDRFQQKLQQRQADPATPEPVRERIMKAIRHIDLCFMGTIDAFCGRLIGEHPSRAGVPSSVLLAEDAEKPGLYRREYARLKHGEYGEEMTELFRAFCSVQEKPDQAFADSIPKFMDAHGSRWVTPEKPETDWRTAFSAELDRLLSVLEILAEKRENLYEKNQGCRDAAAALPDALKALRGYGAERSFPEVLNALKKISASDNEKTGGLALACEPGSVGIEAEDLFVLRGKRPALYCLCLSRDGGLISRFLEYQYALTVGFLAPFSVRMAETLKAGGRLSFYDHLLYLRNMLREDAAAGGALVRHIRSHYSHFLIDEFQDTDPLQAEVFFRLASETPTEDWRKARPVPGSLFIVGDPKQSIYRFRGADVQSYLSIRQLFVPPVGEVLSLQQNFRSGGDLRHWFNESFLHLLPEDTAFQSRFSPIPLEEEAEGLLTGAWRYPTTGKENAGDVAALIRRLVDNPDILIRPRKEAARGEPPRRIRYRDIMVITRTRAPLAGLLQAMKALGIPCRVNGRTAFSDCRAFVALADLTAAFAAPMDSQAAYRVLRGPLFGFSRTEITAWKLRGYRLELTGHEEETEEEISAVLAQLNDFRRKHIMLSPSALCRAALEEFRVFPRCGSEDMEYVWFAIELLRGGAEQQGSQSLTDAATFLRDLAEGKTDAGRVLDLSADPDQVYLANLHKVKGLEAPVVILAQTSGGNREPEVHMEAGWPEQTRWALKLANPGIGNITYAVTERFEEEREKETAHLNAEEARLMYVAATRAGCALMIPDTGGDCVWNALLSADAKSLETVLPPLPEGAETAGPEESGFEQQPGDRQRLTEENPLRRLENEKETWRLSLPSTTHDSDLEPEAAHAPDPGAELPRGETSSLLLGKVIHRAMEMLVSSRAVLRDEEILRSIREEYGLEEEDPEDALAYVRAALETVRHGGWKQEPGVPADILSELLAADEVYCEVPFCVAAGDAVTSGIMDVVYRRGDTWHVVDYKTNQEPHGLDLVYQDQLTAYRIAARQLLGADADAHTYHIPLLK